VNRPSQWLLPASLLALVAAALVASGLRPYDRLTWLLEVLPVLVAAPLLVATFRRFPLTPLVYWLVALHALVLILGGHYTYARVPLGFWMQDWFDFTRNHYDRIGHLMQGFAPAIVVRELLLRTTPLAPGRWLFAIILFTVLGVSATYELVEWWTALASEEAATAFLGTSRSSPRPLHASWHPGHEPAPATPDHVPMGATHRDRTRGGHGARVRYRPHRAARAGAGGHPARPRDPRRGVRLGTHLAAPHPPALGRTHGPDPRRRRLNATA
jgi:putative membrane protein